MMVPRIRNIRLETVGANMKGTVVSEDGVDADYNDTIVTVQMNAT